MIYYVAASLISALAGFSAGWFVFRDAGVDFSAIESVCRDDKSCVLYLSCLSVNSKDTGGQNPRNCDDLSNISSYERKIESLKSAWLFCAQNTDPNVAAVCREYIRPK